MEYVHSGLFNGIILSVIDDVLIDGEVFVTTIKLIFGGGHFFIFIGTQAFDQSLFTKVVGMHNLLLSNNASLPLHQTPICEYIYAIFLYQHFVISY